MRVLFWNIELIFVTLLVSQLASGERSERAVLPVNVPIMFVTLLVSQLVTPVRSARLLKAKNHSLRYEKLKEVDYYKDLATDIPVAVRLF